MFLSFSWAYWLSPLAGVMLGVCDKRPKAKTVTKTAVCFFPVSG